MLFITAHQHFCCVFILIFVSSNLVQLDPSQILGVESEIFRVGTHTST
jgi:hypothetical protein